jgi:short-subunit dehydrogenase
VVVFQGELTQMLKQEPLPTHDWRKGNRGAIVNIASQLGLVSRPSAGECQRLD